MKLFEEFENDLEHVFNVKDLTKVMLGNGIEKISVNENGVTIELTVTGLLLNVPAEKWEIIADGDYMTSVGAREGIFNVVCQVRNTFKSEFTQMTGFEFPEVEKQ